MGEAAAEKAKYKEAEDEGVWTKTDKTGLADDDLQTTENVQISHPGKKGGPNIIKDNEPAVRITRSSNRQKLLSTMEISGRCPTACHIASMKF